MSESSAAILPEVEIFCSQCGYSLKGITSERCPECGNPIDWQATRQSQIPWEHRRAIGNFTAFRRTAWLVFTKTKSFAQEVQRPVGFEEAQRFRHAVVVTAMAPLALLIGVCYLFVIGRASNISIGAFEGSEPWVVKLGAVMDYLLLMVLWLALYLTLRALSGVQSYFFHPGSIPVARQNRAVAISYYACAAMAFIPFSLCAIGVLVAMYGFQLDQKIPLLIVIAIWIVCVYTVIVPFIGWWINCIRLLSHTTHCSRARKWRMGIALPVIWLLLIGIIGAGIPAAYTFVCLVILSVLHK